MTDPLKEFEALTEVDELRRLNADLQRRLRRAKAKTEDLVAATVDGSRAAMLALGPVPPVVPPRKDKRKGRAEVALWHLTDWQGSKVTTSYNSQVMRERVLRFCDKAERITEIQRASHPVRECVILFGGDMGEGLFNFPTQVFEIDATIFDQYARIARLLVDVVRRALAIYEKVTVYSEWGNHGRIGSKRAAVPASDNFDRMTYELARALLSDEKGKLPAALSWEDSPEDMHRVEIGNYRALLIHGDEIGRNGFASINTIIQHIAGWQSGAYPWQFQDVYMGHYHGHEERELRGGGTLYRTASPESDNRYAGVNLAATSAPSQRVNFIDPKKGRVSAPYRVYLDD